MATSDLRDDIVNILTERLNLRRSNKPQPEGAVENTIDYEVDSLLTLVQAYIDEQVEGAMTKFGLKKGVKYTVQATDKVIVITREEQTNDKDS